MRVLQINHYYPPDVIGGIEVHVRQLSEGLVRRGISVEAVVANLTRQSHLVEENGVRVQKLGSWGTISRKPFTPTLPLQLRRKDVDLIHIHLANPMATISALLARPSAPIVVTYHMDIVKQRRFLTFFRPFLHRFLDRVERIIATSPHYIETSEFLSPRAEKCIAIPYGIDLNMPNPPDHEVKSIQEKYSERIVLFVGRLTYYKSVDVLIRAMKEVQGTLLIIGDGPEGNDWRQLTADLNLEDRVFFLGKKVGSELYPYYKAAQVHVLPSTHRSEAFGIVQLEAQYFGCPCISTRIGTGTDFANLHGVTGLTVEPNRPDQLAEAINTILDNPDLRRQFSENAKKRVREEFDLERMVDRVLEVYRSVLQDHQSGKKK